MTNSNKYTIDSLGYIYYFIKREEKTTLTMIVNYMKERFNIPKDVTLDTIENLLESGFLMLEESSWGDWYKNQYTIELYSVTSREVPHFLQPYEEVICE